ncbi:hypothetical protein NGB36_17625 [Streptomyces sp. RB6PN25]|uniref:Resolvase/invertase-type recombinase catalytic domain-containing protein n=1 Tax=Streptomyces humicola TaxID=2953240 RepID=A0ABT1Q0R5_9ACTN|nr:hypothetical protein [Streptomyces humicola]MCQ4082370.1 hypothetical protein [Streptomyces humicola]
MATAGYSRLTDGHSSGHGPIHGPIPTIIYICERDTAIAERLAGQCRGHAEQRAWRVVDTVIDNSPLTPLDAREGWKQVIGALAEGSVGIVVTWDPASVASGPGDFQTLQATFRAGGTVLVAVTGTGTAGSPPPPDPSPGGIG